MVAFSCQSICYVIFFDSGRSRTVHPHPPNTIAQCSITSLESYVNVRDKTYDQEEGDVQTKKVDSMGRSLNGPRATLFTAELSQLAINPVTAGQSAGVLQLNTSRNDPS